MLKEARWKVIDADLGIGASSDNGEGLSDADGRCRERAGWGGVACIEAFHSLISSSTGHG